MVTKPWQGQGHFRLKVIPEPNSKCMDFCHETGGEFSTERHSCLLYVTRIGLRAARFELWDTATLLQ